MFQKSRTLIFSTAVLMMGTFCAHGMEAEVKEPAKKSRIRQPRPERSELYKNKVSQPFQEKIIELNEFGVAPNEYEKVISYYSQRGNREKFDVLFNLFKNIPVDKRSDALKNLELSINSKGGFRPMLTQYRFQTGGISTNSPSKTKGTLSLIEWLSQLPDDSKKS